MRIGSLFSGIGGLELGLEWAGVGHTAWQVEIDPYCRAVLAQHWPHATRHEDVRAVGAHNLEPVDVICGGFPCPDVSYAGRRAGLDGERSGLWFEFERIIRELRPRWVVIENVRGLETAGLHAVLAGLRGLGYRGQRLRISAVDVGADHERARIFVVAYAAGQRPPESRERREDASHHSPPARWEANRLVDAVRRGALPYLCREDHGVPGRVDRLTALGNSVVPQVAEVVGRRLLAINKTLDAHAPAR